MNSPRTATSNLQNCPAKLLRAVDSADQDPSDIFHAALAEPNMVDKRRHDGAQIVAPVVVRVVHELVNNAERGDDVAIGPMFRKCIRFSGTLLSLLPMRGQLLRILAISNS